MQISSQNPADRKKLILLGILGLVAVVLLWWTFIGFGSSSKPPATRATGQATPLPGGSRANPNPAAPRSVDEFKGADLAQLVPVHLVSSAVLAPPAKRNIFVYYEAPVKPVAVEPSLPTPTPTPTPPVLLASISPANVFARTADFTLEIAGDKFAPQMRVVIDNTELPTRYISPQQLSTTVPAAIIANPGNRQVMLRSVDGKLYSNSTTISIAAPPTPNYSYIGILGTPRFIDTAILQDKANKETLSVQRGDLLGGRFRVTSISEKEVVVVDNNLNVKHKLAITNQGDKGGNPLQRPTPRVESEDDEP